MEFARPDNLRREIEALLPGLVALRHDLHQRPEIHFEEHETSRRLCLELESLGLPHTTGHAGGTGIIAALGGKRPGPVVALRADMDALPITEDTGLPYASEKAGCMHACGHDGHMTCLIGVARLLAHREDQLPGTIKLIFQPAEEERAGGRLIVSEGLLDGVDAVFAQHCWPELPVGTVATRPGPLMASADFFDITIHGKGGHAASPGDTIDPVLIGSQVVQALQSLVSRRLQPWESGVVTVACFHAGSAPNIIPDEARLEGTFRALTPQVRGQLRDWIQQTVDGICVAAGSTATVTFREPGYPPLVNDASMATHVAETAGKHLGPEAFSTWPHASMAAEDFAYYLETTPGAFYFLGNADPAAVPGPRLHTDTFDFNDDAIPHGVHMLAANALEFLAARQ